MTISPFPMPLTFTILEAQDVAVSTSYYVENIGVVQTDTNIQYQLNTSVISQLPGGGLPIPPSGNIMSGEKLVNYFQP